MARDPEEKDRAHALIDQQIEFGRILEAKTVIYGWWQPGRGHPIRTSDGIRTGIPVLPGKGGSSSVGVVPFDDAGKFQEGSAQDLPV